MTDKTDPAFPHGTVLAEREQDIVECAATGLSAVEHVAIELRVPCCDTPWINEAIIESLRLRYAGQIASGLVVGCAGLIGEEFAAYANGPCNSVIADRATVLADVLIAALTKER